MLKNIKLIIFDLDGTMINSAKDIMVSNNLTLKKFGFKPISFAKVKSIIGQGIWLILLNLYKCKMSSLQTCSQIRRINFSFRTIKIMFMFNRGLILV